MKRVVILGCTGSIGTTALTAIKEKNLPIKVVALSAHSNAEELAQLSTLFAVEAACLTSAYLPDIPLVKTFSYTSGLHAMLRSVDADIVLNAIAGFSGLDASLAVLECGFDLALANKESVVCGGFYLFDVARRNKAQIIPVDSEHSAVYELLKTRDRSTIDSIILTASGGPFRTLDASKFSAITVEQALAHPTWKMGRKISIDSATLANKALEVIEASYLFGFDSTSIEVTIHPQSIIHSMIRTKDGAVYAQLGTPNMTLPIINALEEGVPSLVKPLDFSSLSLTFEKPDFSRFPLLSLAFFILEQKGSYAIAFNAADEIAVHAFLDKRISYPRMIEVVQQTLEHHTWTEEVASFDDILRIDSSARKLAQRLL